MFFHKRGLDYYITNFRLIIKILETGGASSLSNDGITNSFCNDTWPELKQHLDTINKHITDFEKQEHNGPLKNVLRAVHSQLSTNSFDSYEIRQDVDILMRFMNDLVKVHRNLIASVPEVDNAIQKMKQDKSNYLPILQTFLDNLLGIYRISQTISPIIKKTVKDLDNFKHLLEQEKSTTDVFENNLKSWLVDIT